MVRFTMFPEIADLPTMAFAAQQAYQVVLTWITVFVAEFDSSDLAVALVIYLIELVLRNRRGGHTTRVRSRSRARRPERITPTLSPVIQRVQTGLTTTKKLTCGSPH